MYLYELCNDWMGGSYVRVYVFAACDEDAIRFATAIHPSVRPRSVCGVEQELKQYKWTVKVKVEVKEGWCSEISEDGLEVR